MVKKIFLLLVSFLFLSCQQITKAGLWLIRPVGYYYEEVAVQVYKNSIIVPLYIGGKIRYFQLDTGAPTSISPDLFAEFGLQVKDSVLISDYYENQGYVYRTIIPEIKLGSTTFQNVKSGVIDPIQSFTPCDIKIDGYPGSDFFAECALQIDIREKLIIVSGTAASFSLEGHHVTDLNLKYEQKAPYLKIHFPQTGKDEEVLFDTGSGNIFYRLRKNTFSEMLNDQLIRPEHILDTLDGMSNGSGLLGTQKDTVNYDVLFDSVNLAGLHILNCPARTFDAQSNSILGAEFLRLGLVTLDMDNSKLYLKLYRKGMVDLKDPFGFSWTYSNEQIVVQSVKKGSEVEKMNIREGYIIKKVNQIEMDSLSLCEYAQTDWDVERNRNVVQYTFQTSEGEELVFTIRNSENKPDHPSL